MIEYIRGELTQLTPTDAVIECGGVGYCLSISLATFARLEGVTQTRLLVHEVIREDAHILYGFIDEAERTLFRLLIGVSGVGAGTARIILSSLPVAELEQVIISGQHTRLKAVKGIGAKTAERIIVDLKDKIKPTGDTLIMQPAVTSEVYEEALAALVMLGFPRPQSQKVLKKLFDGDPAIKVETAIKKALAMM
ncbi:MAG: Holliday junction branch migration protein RuvA [Muribaculaceae bacterium]|nr:Holliday junction branch migration protein RuvA [Muribaculaceae bacterium]